MDDNTSLYVKVILPEKPFLVKDVEAIQLPAVDGPYRVLLRRAPALKLLKCGVLVVTEDGKDEKYFISRGVAKIRDDGCTILVREIQKVEDVDINDVKARLQKINSQDSDGEEKGLSEEPEYIAYLQMIVDYFEK